MKLIIDLSHEPVLTLKQARKNIDQIKWQGLYQLSETLINKNRVLNQSTRFFYLK